MDNAICAIMDLNNSSKTLKLTLDPCDGELGLIMDGRNYLIIKNTQYEEFMKYISTHISLEYGEYEDTLTINRLYMTHNGNNILINNEEFDITFSLSYIINDHIPKHEEEYDFNAYAQDIISSTPKNIQPYNGPLIRVSRSELFDLHFNIR
jgi:hypothetical protein